MADNEITFKFVDGSGGSSSSAQSTPTTVPSSPPQAMPGGGPGPTPASSSPPQAMPGGTSETVALLKNINNHLALGEARNAQKNEPEGLAEVAGGAEGGGIGAIAAMIAARVKKVATAVPKAVNFGLDESKKIAQNRNFEVLGDVAHKAADGLSALSPALGGVAHAAVGMAEKFAETVEAFVQLGHKLAPFSGPLTEAEIKSEQRSLMGDVREANALGPDLARLMDAQSRASDELRDLVLPIKQWIVEKLANMMEIVVDGLQEIKAFLAGFEVAWKSFQANVDAWIKQGPQYTAAFVKHFVGEGITAYENAKKKQKAEDQDGLAIQQLWGLWNQLPGAGRPADRRVLDILGGMAGTNPNLSMPGDGGMGFGGGAGGEF